MEFFNIEFITGTEELKREVRRDILEEIEWKTFEVIQTIWHIKQEWEDDYAVINIYESIKEEGIIV